MELKPFLKELISAPGLSGYEAPVRALIETAWEPLVDELETSRLGSLHGLKRGRGTEPRPSLLFAAHMDAIGLMVTTITDGFLHFTEIGGIDSRVLPGQLVTVHGREDVPGVIANPPAHLLGDYYRSGGPALDNLLVDTGLTPRQVKRLVRAGDVISFAQPPVELGEDLIAGHTLDNRASVAAVTACLEVLQTLEHQWDIWAVATVQEEESLAGAFTSGYALQPQIAVAVDVTHATGPGTPSHKSFPLDKGPVLGWGPNIHPGLFESVKELADQMEYPYQTEVMPRHSGTDAYALQVTAAGIPTMVVYIPLRYMHTPVEVVSFKDITRTGRLLAAFAASLEANYLDTLTWKD